MTPERPTYTSCQDYVKQVLACYERAPGTRGVSRPADRRLAFQLFEQGVSIEIIEKAVLLASARRLCQARPGQTPLPVRSLHYFLPAIHEVFERPLEDAYATYLRDRIRENTETSPENRSTG